MKMNLAVLSLMALSVTGCASMDRTATKLDMMAGHVAEQDNIVYEGRVTASRHVGSMIAMEFEGGKMYDVEYSPFQFKAGDTVRIYKNYKGLEARLWRESK